MLEHLRPHWTLAGLLLVALVVRLFASVWWQSRLSEGQRFGFPDSDGYWELAEDIAAGRPYEYQSSEQRIFRTPGYPLLLGCTFRLLGPQASPSSKMIAARLLSAVLGTISVALVFVWAKHIAGIRAGWIAGVIAALHPEAIGLGVFLLSEAPFVPLMLLHLMAWSIALKSGQGRYGFYLGFGAGIAGGLATLCRPSWLLFAPFSCGIGLLVMRDRKWQLLVAILLVLGQSLVMLPWWVRNYSIAGRWVPTSLQVGASLYDGLSPTATGASDMRFVEEFRQQQHAADAADLAAGKSLSGIFEDRLDQRMRDASVAWAQSHMGRVLQLWWIKLQRMWAPWPNAGEFRSLKVSVVLFVCYIPLMVAVAWGIQKVVGKAIWSSSPWFWASILPALYFTSLHTIFVSSIRYRQPALLPLMVLAAWALAGPVIDSRRDPFKSAQVS